MLVSRHCAGENNKHTLYIRILCQTVPSGYTEMECWSPGLAQLP